MKALTRVTLALAAAAVVCPAFAADKTNPNQRSTAVAEIIAQRAKLSFQPANPYVIDSTSSGPRLANPVRSYPPSCLAYPLPDTPAAGATVSTFTMPLYTRDANGTAQTPETVTVTLWYVPCSSSGTLQPYNVDQGPNGALLMRIARDASVDGHTDVFPTFPLLSSTQTSTTQNAVRGALEPNTYASDGPFDSPVYSSTTYTLENYQDTADAGITYFNNTFTLIIDPVIGNVGQNAVSVPLNGYTGTGLVQVPIDGFVSSAYFDPSHAGEGLVIEVYDNGDNSTRTVFASWYTYGTDGLPFWIDAQGVVSIGATSMSNSPVYYFTGGGFAGNFGSTSTLNNWGTMSMSWSNCNTLNFSFNGATDPSIPGPSGNSSRTWVRLADINGLNCE